MVYGMSRIQTPLLPAKKPAMPSDFHIDLIAPPTLSTMPICNRCLMSSPGIRTTELATYAAAAQPNRAAPA